MVKADDALKLGYKFGNHNFSLMQFNWLFGSRISTLTRFDNVLD